MEAADAAIWSTLESKLLHPRVLDTAIKRAVRRLTESRDDGSKAARRELERVEGELGNLAAALAAGGDLPALLAAIKEREAHRRDLLERLQESGTPAVTRDPKAVRADLEKRLSDWRSLLRDHATKARGLLKQLIVGRLKMWPDFERNAYRFEGTGTLIPVLSGIVPHVPQCGSSPTGFGTAGDA